MPNTSVSDSLPATSANTPATLTLSRPWVTGTLLALVPALLTSVGFVVGQIRGLDPIGTYASGAVAITACALIGLTVLGRTRPTLRQYGFRTPTNLRACLWFLPALAMPALVFAGSGWQVPPASVPVFAWLAVATAFNEEIWYRGSVLAAFRGRGARYAVVASSALFGVLHLANLAGGASPLYAVLQWLFATLFGFVAAELVAVSGSLWPAIVWHAVYDFTAFASGDALDANALVALGVGSAILAAYAVWLWRRLP